MIVARLARTVLPSPVRTQVRRAFVSVRDYRRARRVLRTYSRHYADVRRQYRRERPGSPVSVESLAAVGVRTVRPGAPGNIIALPPNHLDLVERLHHDVQERLSWTARCRLYPLPASAALPERTADVAEVRQGGVLTLQLAETSALDGLEEFCAHVIPEVERAVYGAYVLVDKVYVYRTLVSRHRPAGSSWAWHYDEHPREVLKLMIYLTDVTEDAAPFTYLSARESGHAVLGSRNPLFGQSRIPAPVMEAHAAQGCRARAVTGPRGTVVLFNDNVIHRATLADRRCRDVLVLQLRPTCPPRRPFIDPRWTGSFQHLDFNRDPNQVEPQPWPRDAGRG